MTNLRGAMRQIVNNNEDSEFSDHSSQSYDSVMSPENK